MSDAFIKPERLEEGEQLGQGGFGRVYTGILRDERKGQRKVALKCPKPDASKLQETLFLKEVIDTIQISRACPNVIQCFGFSAMRSGAACLVMELYSTSLHKLLCDALYDPLPVAQRAQIAADIVEGVAQLHNEMGTVVEDIKPANVLLDGTKRAYLADLGSTKRLSPDVSAVMTRSTTATPYYEPPEKMKVRACPTTGGAKYRIGRASDIWSLGITLLQLGRCDVRQPYPGMTPENVVVQLLVHKEKPEVPAMPELPGLQQLIQRCLQLEPHERITTEELRRGVQDVLRRVSPSARACPEPQDMGMCQAPHEQALQRNALLSEGLAEVAEVEAEAEAADAGKLRADCGRLQAKCSWLQAENRRQQARVDEAMADMEAACAAAVQAEKSDNERLQVRLGEAQQARAELQRQLEGLRLEREGRAAYPAGPRPAPLGPTQPQPAPLSPASPSPPAQGFQAVRSHSLPDLAAALGAARSQRRASIIDLSGPQWRLEGALSGDLLVPDHCTVRNGSIRLPEEAKVIFEGNACLDGLVIKGADRCDYAVDVSSKGRVRLQGCTLEGGGFAAVAVRERGSKLVARSSSMHSSTGYGLHVNGGGNAVLENSCRADGSGSAGWVVRGKGSHLSANGSSASENGGVNAYIDGGATANMEQCVLDGSTIGCGLCVCDEHTSVNANGTSISGNTRVNVFASKPCTAKLSGCRCDKSAEYAWYACFGATITADAACTAKANGKGIIDEDSGGRVVRV